MARRKFRDVAMSKDATSGVLSVVPFPEITVFEPGTSSPIVQTLYAGATGGTTKSNPFTGDADGSFEFYLDDAQDVKLTVDGSGAGFGTYTVDHETVPFGEDGFTVDVGRVLGEFSAYGDGAVTPGQGLHVYPAGRVAIGDQAHHAWPDNGTYFQVDRETADAIQVMDIIFRSHFPGTTTASGTASSATATSLTVSGAGWTPNQFQDSAIRIATGVAAGQQRWIDSNTDDTITWVVAMSPSPATLPTTFHIVDPGDLAALRIPATAKSDSITSIRNIEAHLNIEPGSVGFGSVLQLGLHAGVAPRAATTIGGYVMGVIDIEGADDIADIPGQFAIMTRGLAGFIEPYVHFDTSNTKAFDVKGEGYVDGVRGRFGMVSGALPQNGTAPLAVYASGVADAANGLQVFRQNSANYLGFVMGSDDNAYWMTRSNAGATAGSSLIVGGVVASAALQVSAMAGLTGNLATFGITGSSLASIRVDGLGDFTTRSLAVMHGNGAPTDALWGDDPPNGSVFIRDDGGAGTRFYGRIAGAWVALA